MLSWAVAQRVGEIGVRMAVGAWAIDVSRMVLKRGGRLIVFGIVFGVAAAFSLGRLMSSQIHGVSLAEPTVYAVALVGSTAVALLANWLPERRAARVDPMRALREE